MGRVMGDKDPLKKETDSIQNLIKLTFSSNNTKHADAIRTVYIWIRNVWSYQFIIFAASLH